MDARRKNDVLKPVDTRREIKLEARPRAGGLDLRVLIAVERKYIWLSRKEAYFSRSGDRFRWMGLGFVAYLCRSVHVVSVDCRDMLIEKNQIALSTRRVREFGTKSTCLLRSRIA
ncbi:hypothetical protein AVEN_72827-1 [Araneus ventricosus]|uniref:Uncharacterized protein n=1 Tax=Araneus ventricosus TaxID=182803 RepID=A0A4Y2F8Q3_ARAVE|nr:hypothetical protein AVEN_72827-1 [Araneus ventricosus]